MPEPTRDNSMYETVTPSIKTDMARDTDTNIIASNGTLGLWNGHIMWDTTNSGFVFYDAATSKYQQPGASGGWVDLT